MEIKVHYLSEEIEELRYIDGKSDWIDLRAARNISLKKGEFCLIPLGIAVELPAGYEAHIVPRSSTFKNFGIIQTNSMGIIENDYNGDNDIWGFPAVAIRKTFIPKGTRVCQFCLVKKQTPIEFKAVESLGNKDRGGFGSTGDR